MTTTTLPVPSDTQGAESQWTVETHGLTKRFGANVVVNGVELLVPRGCAFGCGVQSRDSTLTRDDVGRRGRSGPRRTAGRSTSKPPSQTNITAGHGPNPWFAPTAPTADVLVAKRAHRAWALAPPNSVWRTVRLAPPAHLRSAQVSCRGDRWRAGTESTGTRARSGVSNPGARRTGPPCPPTTADMDRARSPDRHDELPGQWP